jgi:phosphatidylethanolamine/phosphatidyl-N-methylethanolamine N-methyltransferase
MSWHFFREFCSDWRATGAVAPSSRVLASRVVELAGVRDAKHILELGPGTGPFTEAIQQAMSEEARYLGLELNGMFVKRLRERFSNMQFEAVAAQEYDFDGFLQPDESFDCIISGLPWTAFPPSLQTAILDHALTRLKPGGRMVTFAYTAFHLLPAGRHFAELLAGRCASLERSRTIWGNVPPAFVYTATKA